MKLSKNFVFTLIALVVVAALYRVVPGRPFGFAPQIAMAIFAGAVIKDRKTAFALPLISMFISDAFYQILYVSGLSIIPGFYEGQATNYILFTLLTVVGFLIKKINIVNVAIASIAASTIYFLTSNFMVWLSGTGGYQHPQTFNGLMMTIADGVPFYKNSIWGTLFFSVVLFGGYYFFFSRSPKAEEA
ncbi:hypothetical protein DC498_20920 [Terrimonas sp.]|uniref:DUF6580 family putative transport protein n=1 Tax=Terrimonas sp. TaxID=1914338 RepID=UPI000D509812|nr:DUF6580 family putative transport protein [Terrimonas sp.]PVD50307.1 hypothetical protein DC498_20920 [Terrimonas sp.]